MGKSVGAGSRDTYEDSLGGDDAKDVGFLHDDQVFTVDLHFGARPLAEQDAVAGLQFDRYELAAFVAASRPHGDDFAFLRFFLGGVGNDDPALGLFLSVDSLDDHAIV